MSHFFYKTQAKKDKLQIIITGIFHQKPLPTTPGLYLQNIRFIFICQLLALIVLSDLCIEFQFIRVKPDTNVLGCYPQNTYLIKIIFVF